MLDDTPVAVVTGANRGLGLETARQLAQRGYRVILTSRQAEQGGLAAARLTAEGFTVAHHVLDVTHASQIATLAAFVRDAYGRVDALINNAGILTEALDAAGTTVFNADPAKIRLSFETNTLGPLMLSISLVPLMRERGCIVNVSSGMGQLSEMNGGWPAYRLSKTALNAVTRILADELQHTKIKINSVCPGWVRTDMGGPNAERNIPDGVRGIVWAATLPADGPSGGFFRDGRPIAW